MKHFLRIQFYDLTGYGDHIVVFVKASASSSPTVSYILNVRSLRATNFITRSLPLRVLSIKCYLHKCIIFEISIANKTCCITLLYSSASQWISYIILIMTTKWASNHPLNLELNLCSLTGDNPFLSAIIVDFNAKNSYKVQIVRMLVTKLLSRVHTLNLSLIVIILYLTSIKIQIKDKTNYKSHNLQLFLCKPKVWTSSIN